MSDEFNPPQPDPEPEPEPEPEPALDQGPIDLGPMRTPHQCQGVKANGDPCGQMAIRGTKFCRHHGGITAKLLKQRSDPHKPIETVPFPFHDGGVNENAAIRMIRMIQPNCPNDSHPEILKKDGTSIPNPRYTGEPNCQLVYRFNNHGKWDVEKCISLGHDPYYTVFRKTIVEEEVGLDGYIVSSRQRVIKEKRLNIIQVSDNPRHTNRTEVALALAKGCVFLEGFKCHCSQHLGPHKHEPPCEFRNCSQPQRVDTRYGKYCSERHARLVAADMQRVMLPVGGDPYSQDQAMREREDMLGALNIRKGA